MSGTVKRVRLERQAQVWVRMHVNGWDPLRDVPALLIEWEGRGPAGARRWRGRITVDPDDAPPAWNPRLPWYDADHLRPRTV